MYDHGNQPYDPSLFRGTADYYQRYRLPYPEVLIESLDTELGLDGTGSLLDIGCGTGAVIEVLARKFARVIGVDPDPDMLSNARRRVRQLGFDHVEFLNMRAEDISSLTADFRVITFGASFHWTDRLHTAGLAFELLQQGGALVLLGSNSPWKGREKWQEIALDQIQAHLGKHRRAGKGRFEESPLRHEEVLKQVGFVDMKTVEIDIPHTWTLENFIGYLYSTSFASQKILGEKASAFESGMREALLAYDSRGIYSENVNFYYICGRKML